MGVTKQHGLMGRLLDYVVEQSKDIDPRAYTLTGVSDFRRFPKDLQALPGVELDRKVEGDHVWLQVQRLKANAAPKLADESLRPFITIIDDPMGPIPEANEKALKYQAAIDLRATSEDLATRQDVSRRAQVALALTKYTPLWRAWAEGEKPRRRAISLYGDLFMLKARLEAEETSNPSELVWGMGVSAWKLSIPVTQSAPAPRMEVDFQYPLLTQVVEIELDPQTHTISVRPRAVPPRLEFDAFGACQVMGAAEVEKQIKLLLDKESEHPVSPFDVASCEPILRVAAGNLDREGRYDPTHEGLPLPSHRLLVTAGWVLLVRERSVNYLVEDIRKLKERLLAGDAIPAGPLCIVSPPPDEVVRYEPISFRGLCGGGHRSAGEQVELHFPLPYNQEQETIVEMLEHAPGVSVQGPPGTGKTHTIANIICHYLATGRKVLVTSKGEQALKELQDKIPQEVRPLTVALMAGDRQGMRQFQAAIDAIIHNLSQLNPRVTQAEIEGCRQKIDAAHTDVVSIDRRLDEIAQQQLSGIEVDGMPMRAQKMAELVVRGRQLYGWFDDDLTLASEHAPALTATEAQALRDVRRKLGPDIVYATARLPSSFSLLQTESLGSLHSALVGIREIDDAENTGGLRALRALTPSVLEDARRMLKAVEYVINVVQQLEELHSPWVLELRSKCRRLDFKSEQEALKALFGELEDLVRARAAFMRQPVSVPPEALANPRVLQAVERAQDTGKPFGAFAFGNNDVKALVAAIRVSGLVPDGTEQWQHVHRYFELHSRVLSFSVRWNQFAEALSVPPVKASVESLRSTEQMALAAKKAHELATLHDVNLPALAERVFRDPPKVELKGGSSDLQRIREQLYRHLTRAELAAAASQLAILQEKLAGTSGPVAEQLRSFVDSQLGNPKVPTERAVAQYAELIGELKRIEALSGNFDLLGDLCHRIEVAGAPKLAARLRTKVREAFGDDDVLPVSWRDAWNWARLKNHLNAIEAREEIVALAGRRRDQEKVLSQQYERMVSRSAWLEAKSQASAKVLSALESYRVAVRKIGQGTGPNATRYRRDAQRAMVEAQGAIPCWIMSHAKVSESMPAAFGAFDLVIVDEASQSNLWALPAAVRGKKILVVGDDKQVSPDGGFISSAKIQTLRERFLGDQPYAQDLTPDKSLYDIASTVFAAQRVMLAEHFRCVQPIIAYSNRTFYRNLIRPLRVPKASERIDPPLVDVFVKNGVRAGDVNQREAEFIAAEIDNILRNPKMRDRTIGVVSLLGPEQAHVVDKLVRGRCDAAELIRRKFESGDARVFQGSERDIMFLTMVADSREHRALSGNMFEQRFNVAASRARDRMYLVRSVKLEELSAADLRRTLIEHFGRPLEGNDETSSRVELCESGFERDVYTALFDLGYRVTPQVKVGAYRIDMVVEGGGDVRLAIECDGDEFHGPDRWSADMQRQRTLERAGWVFWRCFASTWSLHRDDVLTELRARLQAMGLEPVGALERTPSLVEYREWPPSQAPNVEDVLADAGSGPVVHGS